MDWGVRLALGSNMGDRDSHLAAARELIAERVLQEMEWSPIHQTEAVGPPQGRYLNQVVKGVSRHQDPVRLLEECLQIETDLGRVRELRWGPRVIDIDLLTFGSIERDEPPLTLPHPRIHQRSFVLAPWAQLEPEFQITAGGKTVLELLQQWSPPVVEPLDVPLDHPPLDQALR